MSNKFGKSYKLCSKKAIESIFNQKQSVKAYPMRLFYLAHEIPSSTTFQIAVSVPKKKFKRAPDRNLLKRRIKEAIRLNKSLLEEYLGANNKQLALFLIYSSDEILCYAEIEKKIILILKRLVNEVSNSI